jgi:hypothetical protein
MLHTHGNSLTSPEDAPSNLIHGCLTSQDSQRFSLVSEVIFFYVLRHNAYGGFLRDIYKMAPKQ